MQVVEKKIQIEKVNEPAEYRKISIPTHRMAPLKQHWMKIYTPLVENLKLQVRMNVKGRFVEIRVNN